LERAKILSTTPLFAKIHTESASSILNQTAPHLDTELHFTCFVEAPEAEFRWIARDRDGKDAEEDFETEREEVARQSGTGMRLVELDGRRDGPIDHGECKEGLLKVSRCPILSMDLRTIIGQFIGSSPRHQDSIYCRLDEPQL